MTPLGAVLSVGEFGDTVVEWLFLQVQVDNRFHQCTIKRQSNCGLLSGLSL